MSGFYPRVKASLLPLIAVSGLCMIASGGYIAWAGMFGAVWGPVVGFFASPMVFPLMVLPAAMFGGMMRGAMHATPRLVPVFQFLSIFALTSALSVWGAWVFAMAGPALAAEGTVSLIAPVWCVAAATAPWAVFARGDRDNIFFTMVVGMLCLGALTAAALRSGMETGYWTWFLIIDAVMLALAGLQAAVEAHVAARK